MRITDVLDQVRRRLQGQPATEPDETSRLVDEVCETIERVQRARTALYEGVRDRPDLARALLLARDGGGSGHDRGDG
jgi:hypothetical protein